jgi:type III pantothenate kinase
LPPHFRQRAEEMLLLLDIGNTHTHFAVWNGRKLRGTGKVETKAWSGQTVPPAIRRTIRQPAGVALCSVVPAATRLARNAVRDYWQLEIFELTHSSAKGIGIDYPKPETIGPDRLANAIAARQLFGAPVVVVDFGTAVTFDVVNRAGNYVGGVIAPGLAAMTTYLHEKTALLPRITIRDTRAIIGKNTK